MTCFFRGRTVLLRIMFDLVKTVGGVEYLQSGLLRKMGVPHAFSTRIGGVSSGPFSSLNLGNPQGAAQQDSATNIRMNQQRLAATIESADAPVAWVRQVHGNQTAVLLAGELAQQPDMLLRRFSGQTAADAIVCNAAGVLLSMRIADCAPILLATLDGTMVAAIHAGWRGAVANAAGQALSEMGKLGAKPAHIVAAIGPAIGPEAFEVGHEVAAEFGRAGLGEAVKTGNGGKPHIDLSQALEIQLRAAGLKEIDTCELCTVANKQWFFSHRRENGITGRMAAMIRRPI